MRQLQLEGLKFGKLTSIKQVESIRKHSAFLCLCECGNERVVKGVDLKSGKISCCGCSDGDARRRVKYLNRRMYEIWKTMRARCRYVKHVSYKNYGERGIKVCKEWDESFVAFYQWAIINGYKDDLEIDRKNNDGNYEPENCRWVTSKDNSRNTRRNKKMNCEKATEIRNSTLQTRELSEFYGVSMDVIRSIKNGKSWIS